MGAYQFDNLSPADFQYLARDLLQRRLGVFLESYGPGPDAGVDLKGSYRAGSLVVQAKHYASFEKLYSVLKNSEVSKVKKLKPSRYLLATTVALTQGRKAKLLRLFEGYIASTEDVLGRQDIENLIGDNPDIERRWFKLWLGNTETLRAVLHSKEYALSSFAVDGFSAALRYFVAHDGFDRAMEVLLEKHFVIVSGIPGIGKSLVATMLGAHILEQGIREFFYVSGSIDEALAVYDPSVPQVFLYDDFLGANFLKDLLPKNEDRRIVMFLQKIAASKSHYLIMTTREYILRQAETSYEAFSRLRELEIGKCIIDLEMYTRGVRARILYNHFYFSGVPAEYVAEFIEGGNLLGAVDHRNFSPRIVGVLLSDMRPWEQMSPAEFSRFFMKTLSNPEVVWDHGFENQISEVARDLLLCLATAGGRIDVEALYQGALGISNVASATINSCRKALHELVGSFAESNVDRHGRVVVQFANPSISDYLVERIRADKRLQDRLVRRSVILEGLTELFCTEFGAGDRRHSGVVVDYEVGAVLRRRVLDDIMVLPSVRVFQLHYQAGGWSFAKPGANSSHRLLFVCKNFDLAEDQEIRDFVVRRFELEMGSESDTERVENYLSVLEHVRPYVDVNAGELIKKFLLWCETIQALSYVSRLCKLFPTEWERALAGGVAGSIMDHIDELVDSEADYLCDESESGWSDQFESDLGEVVSVMKIDEDRYSGTLDRVREAAAEREEQEPSKLMEGVPREMREEVTDSEIEALFQSLLG